MAKDELVVVMTFNRVNDAELHKSLLDSAGVESVLLNDVGGTVIPLGGLLEVRLAVNAKDEKLAREILTAGFDEKEMK